MHPKSIVIAGASSGLGAALARAFAQDGHRLTVCARREERLAALAQEFPNVGYAPCDVTSEADVKIFFDKVKALRGSVDVLIHCAAVMGPVGPTPEIDADQWLNALKTDLFGAFLVTKHVVPLMPPERRPRILLLAGGGSFDPMPNLSAYGVSKAGIVRLAETLAIELAPRNIAVNVFAPGFVATEIFAAVLDAGPERGGKLYDTVVTLLESWKETDLDLPLECARYLISDASAALTGKTISARFDPWDQPEFSTYMQEIVASQLYGTKRVIPQDLPAEPFATKLVQASERNKDRRAKVGPLASVVRPTKS